MPDQRVENPFLAVHWCKWGDVRDPKGPFITNEEYNTRPLTVEDVEDDDEVREQLLLLQQDIVANPADAEFDCDALIKIEEMLDTERFDCILFGSPR